MSSTDLTNSACDQDSAVSSKKQIKKNDISKNKSVALTPALIAGLNDKHSALQDILTLDCSNQSISDIHDISCCTSLKRLILSNNQLKSPESLAGLSDLTDVSFLDLSNNNLKHLSTQFDNLKKLTVLNLAHNRLKVMPLSSRSPSKLTALRTLVLNDNSISVLDAAVVPWNSLNTLIISSNQLDSLDTLDGMSNAQLAKLNVGHNGLRKMPKLKGFVALRELNLSHNKLKSLSKGCLPRESLEILNLAQNRIASLDDLVCLEEHSVRLRQLNLKGNPVCMLSGYTEAIRRMLPHLEVLDGCRLQATAEGERKRRRRH